MRWCNFRRKKTFSLSECACLLITSKKQKTFTILKVADEIKVEQNAIHTLEFIHLNYVKSHRIMRMRT